MAGSTSGVAGMGAGGTPSAGGDTALGAGGAAGGSGNPSAGAGGGIGGNGAGPSDDLLVVPEDLTIEAVQGGNGVLDITALTLKKGAQATEIYVAVKNTGDQHACAAGVSMELFDRDGQSMVVGIAGLLSPHFYRVLDGTDTAASCVGPGDVSAAAVTDLPLDLVIDDVGLVLYRCPYFALDVEGPIDALTVSGLTAVKTGAVTTYEGTVVNEFDVAVRNPTISVFPVNRVGRPLGVTTGTETVEIAPGGTWAFRTNSTTAPGVDTLAFVGGEPVD